MEHPGRGDGTPDVQNDLTGYGRTSGMPGGGVPGQSVDENGNAGALRASACPRHRGDSKGRKIPSPTVRPMRHSGSTKVFERAAPENSPV